MKKIKLYREVYKPAMTYDDLVEDLAFVDRDVVFEFIKVLDERLQDWGFTERM